jgi:hypothetical protein
MRTIIVGHQPLQFVCIKNKGYGIGSKERQIMRMRYVCLLTSVFIVFISCGGGGGGGEDGGVECIDGSGIISSHWAKTYDLDTPGISTEFGGYIQQTSDGGYILAGGVNAEGFADKNALLIKLDSYGVPVWARMYDRPGHHDTITYIKNTMDEGYIGIIRSEHFDVPTATSYTDYLIVRFDSMGNIIWQMLYSIVGPVEQTSDGGYIVSGDRCIFKLNSGGNVEWAKSYMGIGGIVRQTEDGGYIVVRSDEGLGNYPVSGIELLKLDENGEVEWFKTYDYVSGGVLWFARFIQQTEDDGYMLGGYTKGGFFFMKVNSTGNVSWAKFTGDDVSWVKFTGVGYLFFSYLNTTIRPVRDGGYIGILNTSSFNEGFDDDIWVIRFDQEGEVVWQKTYGGDYSDHGNSVVEINDGSYVISGVTMSFGQEDGDIWVLKLRLDGTLSPDVPSSFGVDTDAETVNLNFAVYEWPLQAGDCTVSVSEVPLTVADVSVKVCAQAWD